jgi:hypothetical protein
MLVLEELKKRNIPWEKFIVYAHMKLDIASNISKRCKVLFHLLVILYQEQAGKERENPLFKTKRSSRKLKK